MMKKGDEGGKQARKIVDDYFQGFSYILKKGKKKKLTNIQPINLTIKKYRQLYDDDRLLILKKDLLPF